MNPGFIAVMIGVLMIVWAVLMLADPQHLIWPNKTAEEEREEG